MIGLCSDGLLFILPIGKRAKLSFSNEEDDSGQLSRSAPGQDEGEAGLDSVLPKRHFRGLRIETPTYTGMHAHCQRYALN